MPPLPRLVGSAGRWFESRSEADLDVWFAVYRLLQEHARDMEQYVHVEGRWSGDNGVLWISRPQEGWHARLTLSKGVGAGGDGVLVHKVKIFRD